MNHGRIWVFSVIWNFFCGTQIRQSPVPYTLKQHKWAHSFPPLPVTYFGALQCRPHLAGCFALQPWGSELTGHWGHWDSLHSLLSWLWQYNKENVDENLHPQEGPWATRSSPIGPEGAQVRRMCLLPTRGSVTFLSSQSFWTSECQPSSVSCYFKKSVNFLNIFSKLNIILLLLKKSNSYKIACQPGSKERN